MKRLPTIYAITDIETTGGHASGNAITEIAVCLHDGKKIISEYHSLINPGVHIPSYIVALTGIDDSMVASAPSFAEIAEELLDFMGDAVFVAHNVNFDYSFIMTAFRECGIAWKPRRLCTVRLARKAFPGLRSYSLGKLCNDLDIQNLTPHRALGDARAAAEVFVHSLPLVDEKTISRMLKHGAGDHFLPQHLDVKEYIMLPEKPGVYFFMNEKGLPIYIGKAINIKARVRSHFLGDKTTSKLQGFIREIHHIDYQLTGNEFIALLLEDSLIRKHWPRYNSAQKNRPGRFGVFQYTDQNGFNRLAVNSSSRAIAPLKTFHSGSSARQWLLKLAERFQLDYRVLGIDLTSGNEPWPDVDEHNQLLDTAIKQGVREGEHCIFHSAGRHSGERAFVWIEHGKLKGYGFTPPELAVENPQHMEPFLETIPSSETTLAIVRSFLDDSRNLERIDLHAVDIS